MLHTLTWSYGEVPDWCPSGWSEGIITPDVLLAATYEIPSTVDYRIRRAESPLIAAGAGCGKLRHTGKVDEEDIG